MAEVYITEQELEKLVPNFGDMSKKEQIGTLEYIYRKQLIGRDIDRTLAEIIEKQLKNKK